MTSNFPDGPDNFAALTPGEEGSRRNVPVGGRTNTGFLNDLGDAVEAIEGYLLDNGPAAESTVSAIRQGDAELADRKLFGWRQKLAGRDSARAVVGFLGDSNYEGEGVDTIDDRAIDLTRALLRAKYPTPGAAEGRGYIPVDYAVSGLAEDWTYTGNTVSLMGNVGLGFRARILGASTGGGVGKATAPPLSGPQLLLCYSGVNLGGKTEYRITPDDTGTPGSWIEVNHNNGTTSVRRAEQTLISTGTDGEYLFEWRWKAQGGGFDPTPIVEGVIEYGAGDETIGIDVLDLAHGGYTAANFVTASNTTLLGQHIADHGIDVLLVNIGINDLNLSDHDDVTPDVAAHKTAIETFLARCRGVNTLLEVVLNPSPAPEAVLLTGDVVDWPLFLRAQYEIAAADPLTSVLEQARAIPGHDLSGDDGSFYDDIFGIHLAEGGQAALASQLVEHLSLPAGGAYADLPAVRSSGVDTIEVLTQAEYDALTPPSPRVWYVIVE